MEELFVERDLQWPAKDSFILEVKFNDYCPAWVKPIIASLGLVREPASKYVACVDCHPRLFNI